MSTSQAVTESRTNDGKSPSDYSISSEKAPALHRALTAGGHPLDDSMPAFPVYHRKFGNPSALGLCSFAGSLFVLSLLQIQARGVMIPNFMVGLALFYGGAIEVLAGMWEFAAGNTFGGTVFTGFGAFWLSYGFIFIPASGVLAAYETAPDQLQNFLGFYLTSWTIFAFIMLLSTNRTSIALVVTFILVVITLSILTGGQFAGSESVTRVGGYFGLLTAFGAWYIAAASMLTPETSFFTLPVGPIGRP